jgi:hypothetical protein
MHLEAAALRPEAHTRQRPPPTCAPHSCRCCANDNSARRGAPSIQQQQAAAVAAGPHLRPKELRLLRQRQQHAPSHVAEVHPRHHLLKPVLACKRAGGAAVATWLGLATRSGRALSFQPSGCAAAPLPTRSRPSMLVPAQGLPPGQLSSPSGHQLPAPHRLTHPPGLGKSASRASSSGSRGRWLLLKAPHSMFISVRVSRSMPSAAHLRTLPT